MRGRMPQRAGQALALMGALLAARVAPLAAQAGVISTVSGVTLNATQSNRITVTVTSGAVQTIPSIVDGAINPFPAPVRITTSWSLDLLTIGNLRLVGYFTTPTQAMSNGATNIPSSQIEGRMLTGLPTTFTPFTGAAVGAVGSAGGSLELWRVLVFLFFNQNGSRTDDLELRLNRTGQPALPSGTYAGTLLLRAIVF